MECWRITATLGNAIVKATDFTGSVRNAFHYCSFTNPLCRSPGFGVTTLILNQSFLLSHGLSNSLREPSEGTLQNKKQIKTLKQQKSEAVKIPQRPHPALKTEKTLHHEVWTWSCNSLLGTLDKELSVKSHCALKGPGKQLFSI